RCRPSAARRARLSAWPRRRPERWSPPHPRTSRHLPTHRDLLPEPGAPFVDPFPGPGTHQESWNAWVDGVERGVEPLEVVLQVGEEVDLVDQGEVRRPEHQRVLERFVLAFRDRGDHYAQVLADPELRR